MAMKSKTLDSWRDYFKSSNTSILDIIERAVMVAASDCPNEFRERRDQIAEILFSSKLTKCLGCDRVELSVPGGEIKGEFGYGKESKLNSSTNNQEDEMYMNPIRNCSYGDAEALTNEIEEVGQIVVEVTRIKEILDNSSDETDSVLFESLRKLELMCLSVDTLRATEIGKSVNKLRKHVNKDIRVLARTLIGVWKVMVEEWVCATTAISEATPESVNPSTVDDEEGLPSPPMDEFALFAQPTGIEFSQFFDGIDDDGNTQNSGELKLKKNRDNGPNAQKPSPMLTQQKAGVYHEPYVPEMVTKVNDEDKKKEVVMKKQANIVKSIKPSGPGRPTKINMDQKVGNGAKLQQKAVVQRNAPGAQQDDHVARLEASKRKLQERYQEAQNAKRQRTIQVMELQDLPKQGLGHKPPFMRSGNHNRNRLNRHR